MKKSSSFKGFTIVELLVVIVIIGILAAITIISYTGITQQATVASLQADLANASKQLKIYQLTSPDGSYPASVNDCPTPAAGNLCLKNSNGGSYSYSYTLGANPTFTLDATSANGAVTYRVTDNTSPIAVNTLNVTGIAGIAGSTVVGSTLTAGALTPSGATATYQWQSSDVVDGVYSNISGATSGTYVLTSGDWKRYIKVVATGSGSYSGAQTSAASSVVSNPNWIAGVAATAMENKYVYALDIGYVAYKTTNTAVDSVHGDINIDPIYPSKMSLFNPQSYPEVDFSEYQAQDVCRVEGGRLPNLSELSSIYANRIAYGDNFYGSSYWSSTENSPDGAYAVYFSGMGEIDGYLKTNDNGVRCVAD